MRNVSIERVDMNVISPEILGQWANCYCEIWKEPPWNEDFWLPESVIADLRKEMENPDATAFLAMDNGYVVGFTHGYSVDKDELRVIAGNGLLDSVFDGDSRVFYVDELGVAKNHRGRRISSALTASLIGVAQNAGITAIVLRTDTQARVARHVYERSGFVDLGIRDAAHADRTYWLLDVRQKAFMDLFRFDPAKALSVGVEQECFLTDESGTILPFAPRIIAGLPNREDDSLLPRYGYELSACQLEYKIGPCHVGSVRDHLVKLEEELKVWEKSLGFKRLHSEVGPEDIPLDVYPDPSGRYQEIVKTMPRHVLLAACRVIGTHVHVGMPDLETALSVYNRVAPQCERLCAKGNGSFGERLEIYRTVAPECDPPQYVDWTGFYQTARAKGFDKDPRKCWTLIRISKHGTIEFRMFGATSSVERIASWVKLCHDLCAKAMA